METDDARKHLAEQVSNVLYGVSRKIHYSKLPIDCQLDLFDKVIS